MGKEWHRRTSLARFRTVSQGFRTEAALTTHGCPAFAYVFARRQHAESRTAGCDRSLSDGAMGARWKLHERRHLGDERRGRRCNDEPRPALASGFYRAPVVVVTIKRCLLRCPASDEVTPVESDRVRRVSHISLEAVVGSLPDTYERRSAIMKAFDGDS
ncbi:hypothetical protein Bbelb_117320 [Branchiostoma belcheri]|nr:hypothetical protein Bbelb_117320 [Branchiostoma belcheri]